ncbi:MAG: hypothetical protein QFB87_04915 [Patescibacteria group bacterium]|nr:hypothetical protein [Patescibacteria group bacterium]
MEWNGTVPPKDVTNVFVDLSSQRPRVQFEAIFDPHKALLLRHIVAKQRLPEDNQTTSPTGRSADLIPAPRQPQNLDTPS